MAKYLVWVEDLNRGKELDDIRELTDFEYSVGETIFVNSNSTYRCVSKKVVNGDIYHYFKLGIPTYNYNY